VLDVWYMLGFGLVGYLFQKLDTRSRRWCWRWCSATGRGLLSPVDAAHRRATSDHGQTARRL
jgi:hypothetical protein